MFADRGLGFALKASGCSYVTAGNLVSFLLKPWTLLFLLAAGLMGLFFLTVEQGSLLTHLKSGASDAAYCRVKERKLGRPFWSIFS